jgi:hypothetical protein
MRPAYEPSVPQGLKPAHITALGGTAEAVPFHKTIYETSFMYLLSPKCMDPSLREE